MSVSHESLEPYEWYVLYTNDKAPRIIVGREVAMKELVNGYRLTPRELRAYEAKMRDFPIGSKLMVVGELPYEQSPDRVLWRVEEPGE